MRAEISDQELARRLAAAMKILDDAAKARIIRKAAGQPHETAAAEYPLQSKC
jgi:hypothetical protein